MFLAPFLDSEGIPTLDVTEYPFRILNASGDTVSGDLRYPASDALLPCLIVCHGFTAHKDWGPFPVFGRKFAEQGFASIVLNFSHNGIGRNPEKFTEFEKFSKNTIGKEIEDVIGILDAIESGELGQGIIDLGRLGIVGHSRGGAVSILAAHRDRRLQAVASWSGVSTVYRYTDHQRRVWEKEGSLPIEIRSTKTRLRYGIEVLRDLESNRERYDMLHAVRELSRPLLLVHGKADVEVKPREAEELYEAADRSLTELVLLDRVGHMYGIRGSQVRTNPTVEHLVDLTAHWFNLHL